MKTFIVCSRVARKTYFPKGYDKKFVIKHIKNSVELYSEILKNYRKQT